MSMVEKALSDEGHDVICAKTGSEALLAVRQGKVRMVISDWMMPEMDGLTLCRQLRSRHLEGYIYVIMLTSRGDKQDIVEGLSAGADDFLTKPFDPAELCVRVRNGERILSLETRHVAIFALATLVESRDPETGRHLERIRNYCHILTRALAEHSKYSDVLTPEYCETIYLTSPLHDIGKVGIPDCVLLKPGRLTDSEFQVMKTHAAIGGNALGAVAREYPGVPYLRMATDIALYHHERYDGSGYPKGLRGEDIPLCGRVVALTDVYDALTSKRVYKKSFTHDIALSIIKKESGKQFDPDVVDAFLQSEQAFRAIRKNLWDAGSQDQAEET
jgi:putative two-component system response regulator